MRRKVRVHNRRKAKRDPSRVAKSHRAVIYQSSGMYSAVTAWPAKLGDDGVPTIRNKMAAIKLGGREQFARAVEIPAVQKRYGIKLSKKGKIMEIAGKKRQMKAGGVSSNG